MLSYLALQISKRVSDPSNSKRISPTSLLVVEKKLK